MDEFVLQYPLASYTGSSVDVSGASLKFDFDFDKKLSAINVLKDSVNFWWHIGAD
jgi:hypothetical protein